MGVGTITCLCFAGFFLIFAALFALLKGKGAMLISGYNTLPKQEREQYDAARMSLDMRNSLLVWSLVFVLGAILSFYVSSLFSIAAFFVWLILFLKEVRLDAEKAFEKYKK